MARYIVKFSTIWNMSQSEKFFSLDEAVEYWNFYADAEYIISGKLIALDDKEVIWAF